MGLAEPAGALAKAELRR